MLFPNAPPSNESATVVVLDTDVALVTRLKDGDAGAFDELVRTHGPRMMFVIRRFLPQECDAEDALQDAFLNVFRSIAGFAGESRLSTWLHRVAVNAALMRVRARARRPETLMDDKSFDGFPAIGFAVGSGAASVACAFERTTGADARELVRRAVERLPEEARTVVQLRDVYGMDVPEICRLVGVGSSTVKSRLRRGRTTLRAVIRSVSGAMTR